MFFDSSSRSTRTSSFASSFHSTRSLRIFVTSLLREVARSGSGIQRHRVGSDEHRSVADPDPAPTDVDVRIAERVARAQQEVLGPAFGLEAEHVGAEHPAQQLLADR